MDEEDKAPATQPRDPEREGLGGAANRQPKGESRRETWLSRGEMISEAAAI